MHIMGIRAKPNEIFFSILSSDGEIVDIEKIMMPLSLNDPDRLKFLRNTILDTLREFDVKKAGIRVTEENSRTKDIRRISNEAVIQEALSSSSVTAYCRRKKQGICSKLGISTKEFDRLMEKASVFDNVKGWADLTSKEEKESLLVAMSAISC